MLGGEKASLFAPSDHNQVAACARFARSGERGTEAMPATPEH